jgi:glucosamine 6-phosphate synthetase-like amidotransferase/phosphosugar isomerase protein
MCGIAGLFLKDDTLDAQLGELLVTMLELLADRGPDSTGVALYDSRSRSPEIIKDTGSARVVCALHGVASRSGSQGIGHTRMATESAVTAHHSHPFTPDGHLCLVHNGSFSNHASVRRKLTAQGISFDSDNDSEVAARFLGWRLAEGDDLTGALRNLTRELDGFFTLLIADPGRFAVVRDAHACKPAVVAETVRYVAVASEYRALATLPEIESARVFEPDPEEIYTWSR